MSRRLPRMVALESSNVAAVGFRATRDGTGTLYVQFLGKGDESDAVYVYGGVNKATFEAFKKAQSPGRFFRNTIRKTFSYQFKGQLTDFKQSSSEADQRVRIDGYDEFLDLRW